MAELRDYVTAHVERGECKCGKCIDVGKKPDPNGHTADMVFFVCAKRGEPTLDEFRALTRSHHGDFCEVDPFDGKEHNYIELGGWIGDQGLAMQYMALGHFVGAFKLLTPATVLQIPSSDPMAQQMAGMGMLAIQALG